MNTIKIAINAIRVSQTGGGGIDNYIVNVVNSMMKNCEKNKVEITVYTVAPHLFENISQTHIVSPLSLLFLSRLGRKSNSSHLNKSQVDDFANHGVHKKTKHIVSILKARFADHIKMFWTQFIFPFHLLLKNNHIVFSPTQFEALFLSPVPQVLMVLDVQFFLFPGKNYKHPFFLKYFLPFIMQRCSMLLTLTEGSKKHMVNFFPCLNPKRIRSTYLAPAKLLKVLDEDRVSWIRKKFNLQKYIFCVSTGDTHKNLHLLIEAFSLIRHKISENLCIAGYRSSDQIEFLNSVKEKFGVVHRVQFLGHVSDEELSVLYQNAECFIYPTLFTGFGLPPLEAMQYGVPTLVAKSDYITEIVKEGGLFFDPKDPHDIADQILKVLLNSNLKKELKVAGLKRVQQFSWEKCAMETIQAIKSCL